MLHDLGVESLSDLRDLEQDDVTELTQDLKKMEATRFRRALANIESGPTGEVAMGMSPLQKAIYSGAVFAFLIVIFVFAIAGNDTIAKGVLVVLVIFVPWMAYIGMGLVFGAPRHPQRKLYLFIAMVVLPIIGNIIYMALGSPDVGVRNALLFWLVIGTTACCVMYLLQSVMDSGEHETRSIAIIAGTFCWGVMLPIGIGFPVAFAFYYKDTTTWPSMQSTGTFLSQEYCYVLLVPPILVGLVLLFYVTHVEAVLPIGEARVLIGKYAGHHWAIFTYGLCLVIVLCMSGAAYLAPFADMKPLLGLLGFSAPLLLVLVLRLLGHRRLNMREKQFILTWIGVLLPLMAMVPIFYEKKNAGEDLTEITPYFIHVLCSSAAAFILLMHTYVSVDTAADGKLSSEGGFRTLLKNATKKPGNATKEGVEGEEEENFEAEEAEEAGKPVRMIKQEVVWVFIGFVLLYLPIGVLLPIYSRLQPHPDAQSTGLLAVFIAIVPIFGGMSLLCNSVYRAVLCTNLGWCFACRWLPGSADGACGGVMTLGDMPPALSGHSLAWLWRRMPQNKRKLYHGINLFVLHTLFILVMLSYVLVLSLPHGSWARSARIGSLLLFAPISFYSGLAIGVYGDDGVNAFGVHYHGDGDEYDSEDSRATMTRPKTLALNYTDGDAAEHTLGRGADGGGGKGGASHPKYSPYHEMRKMRFPDWQIRQKMAHNGLSGFEIGVFFGDHSTDAHTSYGADVDAGSYTGLNGSTVSKKRTAIKPSHQFMLLGVLVPVFLIFPAWVFTLQTDSVEGGSMVYHLASTLLVAIPGATLVWLFIAKSGRGWLLNRQWLLAATKRVRSRARAYVDRSNSSPAKALSKSTVAPLPSVSSPEIAAAGMEPHEGTCPKGHALVPFITPSDGWTCSSCDHEPFLAGERLHQCAECDYDVCKDCNQKSWLAAHPKADGGADKPAEEGEIASVKTHAALEKEEVEASRANVEAMLNKHPDEDMYDGERSSFALTLMTNACCIVVFIPFGVWLPAITVSVNEDDEFNKSFGGEWYKHTVNH
jgi:hypothetical protein